MKEFLGTTNTGDRAFTSENLHDMGAENTFAGAHSFMRRKYSRDLHGVDIAITGAPFDGATSNRPGARFGPAAIRAASAIISLVIASSASCERTHNVPGKSVEPSPRLPQQVRKQRRRSFDAVAFDMESSTLTPL